MLDCIIKETALIDYAIELGLSGVAITDHEAVCSYIKAIEYMKSLKDKAKKDIEKNPDDEKAKKILNFKLALGNEIYLCRDNLNKDNYVKNQDYYYHFILVAKDKIGNDQIRKLSSIAWDRSYRQFIERVPTYYSDIEDVIGENPGHVIASTACLGGQLARLLLKGEFKKAESFCKWCAELFGSENFFLELQPGEDPDQIKFNNLVQEFIKNRGYKAIVTTDTHYLKKEDRLVHKAFLNSNEGERETDKFYATTYMMDSQEIKKRLNYLEEDFVEELLENTSYIYNMVEEYSLAHKQIVPRIRKNWNLYHVSKLNYPDYPNLQKYIDSKYEDDKYFIYQVLARGEKLNILDTEHLKRIDEECRDIWAVSEKIDERLSAYFTTVSKVIDIGWNEGDTLIGPWRGSSGASLCAYLCEITQRDPLKSPTPLPFFRFISEGRVELPDIDTDSQASKRENFVKALTDYFESIGSEVTAVATFGTETSKAAIQTAARGLGYEPEVGTYLSGLIPIDRGFVRSLKQCYYGDEEKEYSPIAQFIKEMNLYPDIWEVARNIEGLVSHRGVHASGIIITNEPITVHNATMLSPKGMRCTQWDLHDSEKASNLKFDLLTVDALDRIRTTMELLIEYGYMERQKTLKDTYMKYLNPDTLDYDNLEMWKMVGDNKIVSLFQFDTPVGLQCARQIKPTSLLELAQANSSTLASIHFSVSSTGSY